MATVFNIPLIRDDLLGSSCGYMVGEVTPAEYLASKITDAWMNLRSAGPASIVQHFDVFYSLISNFSSAGPEIQSRGWKAIHGAASELVRDLPPALAKSASNQQWQTILKMTVYLLVQLVECYESHATQLPITTVAKGRKGRKKTAPTAGVDWDKERRAAVEVLLQVCQLDLPRLWDSPVIEVEFVNLVTGCCYKLLENPASTRDKDAREIIFHVLGVFVQNYNHGLSASLKIVQLLQHIGEHLAAPLAIAMELFVNEFNGKMVITELIREISRMDSGEMSRDTSGSRALGLFLIETAERVPGVILPSISLLLPLLDGEAYGMRNAVLCTMCEISLQVLSKPGGDMSQRNTRDQFLDKLEEHIHDVNAFVRSKCLQLWLKLCNAKVIPLSRQQTLLDLAIGRLQDKSAFVRRSSVQLLTAMLRGNPFAAKLSIDALKQQQERETQRLQDLEQVASGGDAGSPVLLPEKQWEVMAGEVEQNLAEAMGKLKLTTGDGEDKSDVSGSENEHDDDSSDGNALTADQQLDFLFDSESEKNAERVLEEVVKFLGEHKINDACCLMVRAHKTWPELDAFDWSLDDVSMCEESLEATSGRKMLLVALEKVRDLFLASCPEPEANAQLDLEELIARAGEHCSQPSTSAVSAEQLAKQAVIVKYLSDAVTFSEKMQAAIPVLCQLLGSKSGTDITEGVEFFVAAHQFGLAAASQGIRKMIMLMWSREENVKSAVVDAYRKLYLQPVGVDGHRVKSYNLTVANSLIQLVMGMTLGEVTSLEALIMEWMKTGALPVGVLKVLWDKVSGKTTSSSSNESHVALLLLSMAAGFEPAIVRNNLDVIIQHALANSETVDCVKVTNACLALTKLVPVSRTKGTFSKPLRYPATHEIFQRLEALVVASADRPECDGWIAMAEQAVSAIYALAENPDIVCGRVVDGICTRLLGSALNKDDPLVPAESELSFGAPLAESSQREEDDEISTTTKEVSLPAKLIQCSSLGLARFIALSGQVALKQLVHLEYSLLNELKRRRLQKEGDEEVKRSAANASDSSTLTSPKDTSASDATTAEEEMGLSGATADDAESEAIRRVCDSHLVCGDRAMLSRVRPLLVYICTNPALFPDTDLQTAAALALAKFMLVSADVCEEHLQLLFTIMEKSPEPVIRANSIIAAGDLTFRFPNLIEPWTPNLYARLRDPSPHVRKHTVMVLTHLILNDMVKVKGQISEMALCLEDDNERIASLAQLFFMELAKKGNAIYNILPDIISRLSDPKSSVDEKPFRQIMKYLFSFIQKDRQCESLVEKLCHRFRAMQVERQFRDLSFCLSLLLYSEKGIRRLMENFSCFHDKLASSDVHSNFMSIIARSRKNLKADQKGTLDELEAKLTECHSKGQQDEATVLKAGSHSARAAATHAEATVDERAHSQGGATPSQRPARSKRVPRRKARQSAALEEDSPPPSRRKPSRRQPLIDSDSSPAAAATNVKPGKRRAVVLSSSDGEDDNTGEDFSETVENLDPQMKSLSISETQSGKDSRRGRSARSSEMRPKALSLR